MAAETNRLVICFYTQSWTNLTDRIRRGERPAGTASVPLLWQRCAQRGFDTHVFVVGQESLQGPAHTTELSGVRFHWIKPVAWRLREALARRRCGGAVWWMKIVDWIRVAWASTRTTPNAHIHYAMGYSFSLVVLLLAKVRGSRCIVRFYGIPYRIHRAWTSGGSMDKAWALSRLWVLKLPVDLFIITQDGTHGDRICDALGVPQSKRRFWVNGVRRTEMRMVGCDRRALKVHLGIPEECRVILTVGRLADDKRHDLAVRSLPEIISEFPNTRYVIVGDGPTRPALEKLVSDLRVDEYVYFVGAISNEDLAPYYNAADIYLQTYDKSSFTTTMIEALAAGCCCVARDVGGTAALIQHGRNGVLVGADDVEGIATEIKKLLRDPEAIEGYRRRAFADAMRRFQSWDERLDMEIDQLISLVREGKEVGRVTAHPS